MGVLHSCLTTYICSCFASACSQAGAVSTGVSNGSNLKSAVREEPARHAALESAISTSKIPRHMRLSYAATSWPRRSCRWTGTRQMVMHPSCEHMQGQPYSTPVWPLRVFLFHEKALHAWNTASVPCSCNQAFREAYSCMSRHQTWERLGQFWGRFIG